MGFATVTAQDAPGVAVGSLWFGCYPAADHHVVRPVVRSGGVVDTAEHRAAHAPAYHQFDPADPTLTDDDEAERVLVTSASSKTSITLAHELRVNGSARSVGLTSIRNRAFVVGAGMYDGVVTYDDIESKPVAPSVADHMAGNAGVLRRVHEHLGATLVHSCRVGANH